MAIAPEGQAPSVSTASDSALPEYEAQEASREVLRGTADVADDGRIVVNLDSKVAQVFAKLIDVPPEQDELQEPPPVYSERISWSLPLNICVQVVGSRGDVQPFIALGNELQTFGHRVRLATHNVFKDFVQSHGLEFYPIGGDPAELMAYMVKNPGLIPNMKTLRDGEIRRKRRMIAEMLNGCWKSCVQPDPDSNKPFIADAIIANPPSFAHIHCAQRLAIPLHLVFTMPWSPTRAFPHPLANLQNSTTDPRLANFLSYGLVNCLTWQGLADVINEWRNSIDLESVPMTEGPFLAETLQIPYSYCWSSALVPKPKDWADHIDVSGFLFRKAPKYSPPPELKAFIQADATKPVYIGFGSIVVDDPAALIKTILQAVKLSGARAIVSKGWSGFQSDDVPDTVFFLGDCPHEWLFQHVSAVVHHGGAGTTAAGLLNGRPTAIVPFFGDQPFWGDMVAAAGAGPSPIPHKKLTPDNLSEAIRFCLTEEARLAAAALSEKMQKENGVETLVASFHRHLESEDIRCDLQPALPATYTYMKNKVKMRLSGPVVEILEKNKRLSMKDVTHYEAKFIEIENRRWEVISGSTSASLKLSYDLWSATSTLWEGPRKVLRDAETDEGTKGEPSTAVTARAIGASAMSIPRIYGAILKNFIVDTPLAITEGLRNTPKLYGEKIEAHEPIVDWKSGTRVAGKEFMVGMAEGVTDLLVQPAKGAQQDGAKGLVKGIGKGISGTLTKTGYAGVGLVAYPAQGIYKSLYAVTHRSTKAAIHKARRIHDAWVLATKREMFDEQEIVDAFDAAG